VCGELNAHFMDWTTLSNYCNAPEEDSNAEPCNEARDCPGGTCGVDGVVHLFTEGIVPTLQIPDGPRMDAKYYVQVIDSSCSMTGEDNYSVALEMIQAQWGDVNDTVANCPNGVPNQDVSVLGDTIGVVNKFSNVGCPVQKARADLRSGAGPRVDFKIDLSDILATIGAFQGDPYPFGSGQCVNDRCSGGSDHNRVCANDTECSSDPCN
jgi:hypothetical protein